MTQPFQPSTIPSRKGKGILLAATISHPRAEFMVAPTGWQLWTLALLIYLLVIPILALYAMWSDVSDAMEL